MSILNNISQEQIETLVKFLDRWREADEKANEGRYYKAFQAGPLAIKECVSDFTNEQKQFIQECLDDAIPVIPKINIL